MIFDFDDDKMIKFWMEGASPDPVLDIDNYDTHGLLGNRFCSIMLELLLISLKQYQYHLWFSCWIGKNNCGIVEPFLRSKNDYRFNPFPILGAPSSAISWPRGMPLDSILESYKPLGMITFMIFEILEKLGMWCIIKIC